MLGALSVYDSCGVLGATHTNPTPVAVTAITTASYASWPSTCRPQGSFVNAQIDTLDISDIACPTWGVSDPFYTTCDGDVYFTATYGEPFNPVILVPTEILAIDPAWAQCTNVPSNGPFVLPCGIYDPPRALHTASAMGPVITPASTAEPGNSPTPSPQAQPESAGSPKLPQTTTPPSPNGDPPNQPAANDGALGSTDSRSAGDPSDPAEIPANTNDPPEDPSTGQDPAAAAPKAAHGYGGAEPQTIISKAGGQQSPGMGSVVYSALGGGQAPPGQGQPPPGTGQGKNYEGVSGKQTRPGDVLTLFRRPSSNHHQSICHCGRWLYVISRRP